jgi:UDP-N-acetylmuramate dehydrogenase
MSATFEQLLGQILPEGTIYRNEPMSRHTTFRVGGLADYFVEPENADQIVQLIAVAKEYQIPYIVLGNGSNVLVSDRGYPGMIIHISARMNRIAVSGNRMIVGAGARMITIGKTAYEEGLAGFAPLTGIPGTLGGAVVMNAGAYGGEIKDVLVSATVIDQEGNCLVLSKEELKLGYRTSVVAEKGYIVVEAELEFQLGDKEAIKAQMDECSLARKTKQPLEYPSAGSTFKRPEGYFAGKLIDDAGLRGYQVGGAQVSEKHCGFVINRDQATASDIYQLMQDVSKKVKEQFGITLEPEVKLIGDFS